jgi:hypothetical protein
MNGDEAVRNAPCTFVPSEFPILESVSGDVFSICKPCHDGRNCSSLVIESRDEILLKGVGCDTLGF